MKGKGKNSSARSLERAASVAASARYILRLYITGTTPQSTRAILNIRKFCEEHLDSRYELEVVDVAQHPSLAIGEQIIAAPTLLKKLPLPLRRFIGDMSNTERILLGLDLRHRSEGAPAGSANGPRIRNTTGGPGE